MFEVIVTTSQGNIVDRKQATTGVIGIGSTGQDINLKGWSVAKHHANIVAESDGIYINDLGSIKGTTVNGERARRFGPLHQADTIEIGGMFINIVPCINSIDASTHTLKKNEKIEPTFNDELIDLHVKTAQVASQKQQNIAIEKKETLLKNIVQEEQSTMEQDTERGYRV